jgi:hypothetical protein
MLAIAEDKALGDEMTLYRCGYAFDATPASSLHECGSMGQAQLSTQG